MTDETNLSQEKKWFHLKRVQAVITNLRKRNINALYISSRKEALSVIMKMIPRGATVSRGDSVSIDEIGVFPELVKRNQNKIIDPLERDADGYLIASAEERLRMEREVFFTDVFLTSTNAITLDGKIVSTDGHGNRVSAMIFGPAKVIIATGVNKIVRGVNEAMERIHGLCAPINAKRHALKHHQPEFGDLPCVRTGKCVDCNHDWRSCCMTVIIEGTKAKDRGRINVVLVGEELGI